MLALLIGGLFAVGLIGNAASTASSVATAPGRVIQRTMETDNIITKYEYFHDAYGAFKSRAAQIRDSKEFLKSVNDPAEQNRLRIELSAQKQSCREIVNRYNANATKTNVSIFMGREAPAALDPASCE